MMSTDRRSRRSARAAAVLLVVAMVASVVGTVMAVTDDDLAPFAVCIAITLVALGAALVSWSRSGSLDEEAVEAREPLCISTAESQVLRAELDLAAGTVGRRRLVKWLFGGSVATLAVAALSPFIDLGPRPGGNDATSWRPGRRVVDADGVPVRAVDASTTGSLITAFPEGHTDAVDSQIVLLRVRPELLVDPTTDPAAEQGWVAYSRLCTHLGCPVGMAGLDDRDPLRVHQLVCPCHQSVFDPLDDARPLGGPAPRPLPRLPLSIDDDGHLIATGDFGVSVGPATWRRP